MPRFQVVFASATLPARVRDVIRRRWPRTELLVSDCARRSGREGASALPEDRAPSASLDHRKARAASHRLQSAA